MVLSEDILKIKYRKEAFDVFEIEKGTLLTPSAKQFLNEKGIRLVIKGEEDPVLTKQNEFGEETEEKIIYEKPKYVGKNGECYFEKPEYMTVVDGNVLISKNSKLISLRGKIDTFLAELLLNTKEIEQSSNNKLIKDIETVIKFIQNIIVAEKLDKILENQILLDSKTIKDIKEIIDNPKEYFKKGHLLEVSLNSDLTIHKLNRLRFLARELEIQAIDYFVEDYKVIELVKKELSKYLTEQGIEMKKQISFLGDDKDIEEKLSQKFEISENAETLVVSKLSLKNLYNISNAIYENDYEEKIIKFLLENKEIIIIKEGIEYSKYENIPVAVLKRYEEYIEKIKTYGIKIESKDFYINSLEKKEEVYSKKLLDLNSLRELEIKGIKRLVIENSIVTSSAQEYAKDKNIEIIKRR